MSSKAFRRWSIQTVGPRQPEEAQRFDGPSYCVAADKRRFETPEAAEASLLDTYGRGLPANLNQTTYPCSHCGGYHTTSKKENGDG